MFSGVPLGLLDWRHGKNGLLGVYEPIKVKIVVVSVFPSTDYYISPHVLRNYPLIVFVEEADPLDR